MEMQIKDHRWKENASYRVIHRWVRKYWGVPSPCDKCGRKRRPRSWRHPFGYFNWSMKHNTWSRNRKDWFKLCRECHRIYDLPFTRIKLSIVNSGKKRTKETKHKQSVSGIIAWHKRKKWFKMSDQQKKLISIATLGIKRNLQTRLKMSEAQKKRWRQRRK